MLLQHCCWCGPDFMHLLPRVGFELTNCWSQVQRSTSCTTAPRRILTDDNKSRKKRIIVRKSVCKPWHSSSVQCITAGYKSGDVTWPSSRLMLDNQCMCSLIVTYRTCWKHPVPQAWSRLLIYYGFYTIAKDQPVVKEPERRISTPDICWIV